ncbi:hypothetical protein BKA62DRAFT_462764 [Auriculariales sp. MPI-PUGE-AT-0066]|nr:hypothetical protein BKA62DRAFT_462764 [Auriculariales sp. MPI-PUGE-AT-0066]
MAERKLLELAARGSFPLSRRKLKPRKPYDPASDNGRIALNYGPFDDRVWKAPAAYVPEDERPPASCEFCDENFHPRNKCPSLASVQAIKLAMDRLRSSPNPPHDAKDQFCELELWLVWREEQEGRRAVSIAQEQDEQLRRSQSSSRTERHSFEVDEPSLRATPGPERHSIEADDPFLRATPEPEDELGLKRAMATRLETSGCNIPSGFARLALPASVEEQKADFRRPLVGMLAKSPWYPQSPREPLRYYEAKRAVDAARATKLEKLVVRAYESECQTWQKGVEAFLSLHSADERNFKMKWEVQMLRGPRTDQNLHELVKKYQSAVVPSTMLGRRYKEDFGDATTPTFVRHAIMNGHSLLQPPLVQKSHARQFWHLSNVDWYLGFIPSNSPSMKRADGSLGEHDPRLGMQWHIPGKWYMAFHESPFHHEDSNKANWTTKFHQDATRDFYWYSLDRQHCSRESTEGPDGFSHCFVYHLGAQLITSLVSCHDGMLHLVESVRTDQGALPDLPAEALQAANQVMRQLLEVGMSGRRLVDMIGRYQRLVGEVRAYVYYRRELAKLAKISRRAGNMNSLHVPPANAMLQGWDRRGVLTDDQKTAFHYAQFNIPVGYLHFHDRSFIPGGVQMQVVHLDLCQEVWEDSSDAPPQAPQALRSDLDSHPASGSGRDARLDDMLSFGGVDVFDGSEMDMDVHAAMTEHVSPVQKVPSSSSSTEPSLPVAPPPSRPRPPPRSSTIRNTPSSSTVRNPADTKRRRDESDVAELQEDAEDALKQPRRKKLRQFERNTAKHQPPDWFPVACLVSQQAAMAAPASFERQNAVANRAVFPISSGLSREKMMRHVVPPIDVLLGKSAEYITSMVLRNVVIIAPYLDQRVENLAYDEEEHGLPLTNWQSVLKGHTNDWDHVQGAPNPVARRALAVELGMLSALDGPPRLLELCTPRLSHPRMTRTTMTTRGHQCPVTTHMDHSRATASLSTSRRSCIRTSASLPRRAKGLTTSQWDGAARPRVRGGSETLPGTTKTSSRRASLPSKC